MHAGRTWRGTLSMNTCLAAWGMTNSSSSGTLDNQVHPLVHVSYTLFLRSKHEMQNHSSQQSGQLCSLFPCFTSVKLLRRSTVLLTCSFVGLVCLYHFTTWSRAIACVSACTCWHLYNFALQYLLPSTGLAEDLSDLWVMHSLMSTYPLVHILYLYKHHPLSAISLFCRCCTAA